MIDWVDLVTKVGFPIAVAGFVLVRLNGKMDRLTTALNALATKIEVLVSQDRDGHR